MERKVDQSLLNRSLQSYEDLGYEVDRKVVRRVLADGESVALIKGFIHIIEKIEDIIPREAFVTPVGEGGFSKISLGDNILTAFRVELNCKYPDIEIDDIGIRVITSYVRGLEDS